MDRKTRRGLHAPELLEPRIAPASVVTKTKIRGDVRGSTGASSGRVNGVGQIDVKIIGGSVIGDSTNTAYISVGGGDTTATLAAIKTLKIKGSVVHARLLAGYSFASTAKNLDSGFGSIAIGTIDLAANATAFDGTSISVTAKRGPLTSVPASTGSSARTTTTPPPAGTRSSSARSPALPLAAPLSARRAAAASSPVTRHRAVTARQARCLPVRTGGAGNL